MAASSENWVAYFDSTMGIFMAITPLVVRWRGREGRIANIARVFSHVLLRGVNRRYLGSGWHTDRIILDRKEVGQEPLTSSCSTSTTSTRVGELSPTFRDRIA